MATMTVMTMMVITMTMMITGDVSLLLAPTMESMENPSLAAFFVVVMLAWIIMMIKVMMPAWIIIMIIKMVILA